MPDTVRFFIFSVAGKEIKELEQSGRLLLPPLDIDTESEGDRVTVILTLQEIGVLQACIFPRD